MNKEQIMNFDFIRIDVLFTIIMLEKELQEFSTIGLIIVTIVLSVVLSLARIAYDIYIKEQFDELQCRSRLYFNKR